MLLGLPSHISAQASTTESLHAITLRIDTVQTTEQVQEIRTLIHAALAIRDYDAKLAQGSSTLKVNYTFLDAPEQYDIARQRLEAAGYAVRDIGGVRQQTITVVPEESHVKQPQTSFHAADVNKDGEVTEQEYIRWKQSAGDAQPVNSDVNYHPADTDQNGDVTEEEYKMYLNNK